MIHAHKLTKRFDGFTAVDALSLDVAEGEVLALLGHNGAGKTTTVRCLAAILEPTSGTALVAGHDVVREARTVRRKVGLLTEFPGLYERMVPTEFLDFFGAMHGLSRATIRPRAERLLKHFDLWDVRGRRMGQFSKGMRQKMALVRALLHEPPILFLDEPTSALDPQSAKQVRDWIAGLRGTGHTLILCTHNLTEAEQLADRIAIIARGRLRAVGTSEGLKREWLGPPLMEARTAAPLNGALREVAALVPVVASGEGWFRFEATDPHTLNPLLLRRLDALGCPAITLAEVPRPLEALYLQIVEEGGTGNGERRMQSTNQSLPPERGREHG